MAVNLINGDDTTVTKNNDDIQIDFSSSRNQQIENIETNIANLKNDVKWKTLGAAIGSTPINLPQQFDELLIIAHGGSSDTTYFSFSIPALALSSNEIGFTDGQSASAQANSRVRIYVSNTSAYLSIFTVDGNDVLSTSTITVYYK